MFCAFITPGAVKAAGSAAAEVALGAGIGEVIAAGAEADEAAVELSFGAVPLISCPIRVVQ